MPARCSLIMPVLPVALLACGGIAHAGALRHAGTIQSGWNGSVTFDLERDMPAKPRRTAYKAVEASDRPESRLDWRTEIDGLSAKEELGPHWKFEPSRSGPTFELAALGAGRKERPGLAHVAVDWSF